MLFKHQIADFNDFFWYFQYVGDSSLDRTFALLSRDNYSWEELKQRPLPDGVDPSRLEKYLTDDDFVVRVLLSPSVVFIHTIHSWMTSKDEKVNHYFFLG